MFRKRLGYIIFLVFEFDKESRIGLLYWVVIEIIMRKILPQTLIPNIQPPSPSVCLVSPMPSTIEVDVRKLESIDKRPLINFICMVEKHISQLWMFETCNFHMCICVGCLSPRNAQWYFYSLLYMLPRMQL